MIVMDLNDSNMAENLSAIEILRLTGMFTDEEIQEMYDKQVKADKECK